MVANDKIRRTLILIHVAIHWNFHLYLTNYFVHIIDVLPSGFLYTLPWQLFYFFFNLYFL